MVLQACLREVVVNQANKYRLLAMARKGYYSPGLEEVDQEVPDSLNGHMMLSEENRQLSRPGPSYENYRVGRSRRRSNTCKGLGINNQAFDYYRASGDYTNG